MDGPSVTAIATRGVSMLAGAVGLPLICPIEEFSPARDSSGVVPEGLVRLGQLPGKDPVQGPGEGYGHFEVRLRAFRGDDHGADTRVQPHRPTQRPSHGLACQVHAQPENAVSASGRFDPDLPSVLQVTREVGDP